MSVQTETLKSITRLLRLKDAAAAVVLNGAHATGATSLAITGTLPAAGAPFRVGDGERMTVYNAVTSGGGNVTIASPGLRRDYLDAEPVAEMVASIHGPTNANSVKVAITRDSTDVNVDSQRLPWGLLQGYGSIKVDGILAALSMHALAFGLGAPMSKVLGAGTSNDPYQIIDDGLSFGSDTNVALVIEAVRQDNTYVNIELYGVNFDYTGISLKLARGTASQVPFKVLAASALVSFVVTPWAVTGTDYSVLSTDLLDGLTEVGYFIDATTGALSTTTTGTVAASANVFPLTAVTNIVASDWLKVGSGTAVEFHQVRTIASLNVTTYTRSYRGFGSGATVVRQAKVPLASVNADGATFETGGSVSELKLGTEDMISGYRAGNAFVQFSLALQAFNSTSFALALGLAVPASGTALFVRGGIGNTPITGVYATGTTQGAKTLTITASVCRVIVSADVPFSTQGDAPAIPIKLKPTGVFQVFAR